MAKCNIKEIILYKSVIYLLKYFKQRNQLYDFVILNLIIKKLPNKFIIIVFLVMNNYVIKDLNLKM